MGGEFSTIPNEFWADAVVFDPSSPPRKGAKVLVLRDDLTSFAGIYKGMTQSGEFKFRVLYDNLMLKREDVLRIWPENYPGEADEFERAFKKGWN